MSFANLLNLTPKSNKCSNDRFLSPVRKPSHRGSITPDRSNCGINKDFHLSSEIKGSPRKSITSNLFMQTGNDPFSSPRRQSSNFDTSSLKSNSPKLVHYPSKPLKTIHLPDIPSDFYLSPMDWSKNNVIALALNSSCAFISPKSMETLFCADVSDGLLSLKYSPAGDEILFCQHNGCIAIYDTLHLSNPKSEYQVFTESTLCADWVENTIACGCRDGTLGFIDNRDSSEVHHINAHNEELCMVKIAQNSSLIATSSNDSTVKIWDKRSLDQGPLVKYEEHEAAIKALAWSPCNPDIIASGGGTSDRTIRIWNVNTGETQKVVETGSQVCNLFWNSEYNEILSTHGFSQNHLALWKVPDLQPIASFHSHKQRVLYMAVSPDGSKIATAAPDDSLQIWKMFPQKSMSLSESILLLR